MTATEVGSEVAPCVAEGVELLGEYEGSGYREPHYLARRSDGQVIQLTRLLYLVATSADGSRSLAEIADRVSEEYGRRVSPDNVAVLVEDKLRPLGLVAGPGDACGDVERLDPLLALRFRAQVLSEGAVRRLAVPFRPLFWPPIVVAAVAGWVALLGWLFFVHGVGQGLRQALYQPTVFLLVLGLVVVSAGFHEFGHAAACAYSGARPGGMGAGIYIAWPAFYTDVTDCYRLNRAGRLRTDLGGVYFNVLFSLGTAAAYWLTGFEPLLLVLLVQQFEIIHQLLPFLRMDGYYIVADLTGVPDLFLRLKSILRSLVPWRGPDDRVRELKPWVRVVVSVWVLTVVPLLLFNLGVLVIHLPRIVATAWDSLQLQLGRVSGSFSDGRPLHAVIGMVQIVALVLPLAGIFFTLVRLVRRMAAGLWSRTDGRPVARGALALVGTAVAVTAAYVWWPNGDYEPIQRGERYTVQEVARTVRHVPSGRPALTPQRVEELGGVQRQAANAPIVGGEPADAANTTASTTTTTTVAEETTGGDGTDGTTDTTDLTSDENTGEEPVTTTTTEAS